MTRRKPETIHPMFAHVNTQIYSLIDRLREQHVRRLRRGNTSAPWPGWGVPGRWPRWGGGARCEGESGTGPEAGRTGPDALGSGVPRGGARLLVEGSLGSGVCGERAAEGEASEDGVVALLPRGPWAVTPERGRGARGQDSSGRQTGRTCRAREA